MNTPPVAEIRPRSSAIHHWIGGSKLWLLTLLCLLVSAGLIWWSMPAKGTTIYIQFPEGHGLQPDDTVRYRGIEVGSVESVELDTSLNSVEVEVLLKPFASQLASEGTRFWVVRPELSLTRISGLETAIGHKYIGVSPSPNPDDTSNIFATRFQGLADVPVDTLSDSGIELILRGDKKYSVSKGSAVTFRGVEVGTVLDVALSQEARHVDVRVRIFDQHASLLTSESKFWASSGLDLDFSFGFNGGFNLDTESLETLARGGVSMITTGQGTAISPGNVFTLHAAAEDEWFENAKNYETTDVVLRGAVPMAAKWNSRSLFGTKGKSLLSNGVAVLQNGKQSVLFPSDILESAKDNDTFQLSARGKELTLENANSEEKVLTRIEIDGEFGAFELPQESKSPAAATNCLAVRKSDDNKASFHISIKQESIKRNADDETIWDVIDFNGDRDVWHGAPIVAADDGMLVGILLIKDRKTQILTVAGMGLDSP